MRKFNLRRFKSSVRAWVRNISKWAWQEELDNLYTHQEVANWLFAYHGRYRELTLTEWVAAKRAKGK